MQSPRLIRGALLIVATVLGLACSSSQDNDGQSADDYGAPSSTYPAPHPPAPQVITSDGPILTSPVIVPIVFRGDDATATIQDFTSAIGSSDYWKSAVAEYGVGAATSRTPIFVDPSAIAPISSTVTDDDIRRFMTTQLNDPDAAAVWGTANANAIYMFFFPLGVSVEHGGAVSCTSFRGYHQAVSVAGTTVAYAVIPRCTDSNGAEDPNEITAGASHELAEAATDPFPTSGYAQIDQAHAVYGLNPGSELADMCELDADAFFEPIKLGFVVQRIWSNANAAAGGDPCAPIPPGDIYFAAVPVLTDDVMINANSFSQSLTGPTKGIEVPLGQSKTIAIDLISTAALDEPFTVTAIDGPSFFGSGDAELQVALDRVSGQNGEKIHATITRVKNGQINGTQLVVVASIRSLFHVSSGFVSN